MSTAIPLDFEQALKARLTEVGFRVFQPESKDVPTVVAVDVRWGLLVIDLVDREDGAMVELNRKLARLRNDIPEIARVATQRLVVASNSTTSSGSTATVEDAVAGAFLSHLTPRGMPDA